MAARDTGAEQLIKDTAKHIFFAEGKLHAGTQDIADAAGVSRTLLNYYFRSKDVLIKQVFMEAINDLSKRLDAVIDSDLPFKQKIKNFIEVFITEAITFPYQETFLVTEINCHTCKYASVYRSDKLKTFLKEVEAEMNAGNIEAIDPIQFMINLFSLMAYPLIMKPLHQKFFEISDENFNRMMHQRKTLIYQMIFK
jgi:TetR/AcrR family transcriptional regulator